jgi:CubicO group peptidase (beta-lactamase class C family)
VNRVDSHKILIGTGEFGRTMEMVMIFTKNNLSSRIGLTLDAYTQWRDAKGQDGFRTISLSLAGMPSAPLYTAVMAKYEQPFRGESWARLDRAGLDETIAKMQSEESLHPFLIAATGSGSGVIYAVAFRELPAKPVVKPNLTLAQYQAEHAVQRAAGRILIAVDAFGSPDDIRFCAIWAANPERIAWNAESANDSGVLRQQRFDALISVSARESLLAMTPDGGVTRLFVDAWLNHSWSAKPNLSKTEIEDLITQESSAHRFPVCIGTTTVNGALRCSAIFVEGDEIVPRVFRIRGPEPAGLDPADQVAVKKIDKWMEDYVRAQNFRGAAMAIVEGTRLVYAKGYTLAEPEPYYHDIHPTTLFRMASVSKAYCAVAVWKALADAPNVSRSRTMQSILGLTQPNGSQPVDHDFADVTIEQLLESNSGIDQDSVRNIVTEVKANVFQTQPLTSPQVASQITARSMPGKPGATAADGKQATQYGRTDYFLLGLVVAKLTGASSFESALKKLVLNPLQMTRTRGSRTRIEDQGTDDARHHVPALETGTSAVHNDRRIVPLQYGDENYEVYDGAGGLSSAVVDLARLCALLSCRSNNPLFTDDVLKTFLSDAVAATAAGSDHGYHGFDWANGEYPNVTCSKGGGNPGVAAGFQGTTGRRFIVIARNGNNVDGATPAEWTTDLDAIAATIDWKGADLFPHFGMPALGV